MVGRAVTLVTRLVGSVRGVTQSLQPHRFATLVVSLSLLHRLGLSRPLSCNKFAVAMDAPRIASDICRRLTGFVFWFEGCRGCFHWFGRSATCVHKASKSDHCHGARACHCVGLSVGELGAEPDAIHSGCEKMVGPASPRPSNCNTIWIRPPQLVSRPFPCSGSRPSLPRLRPTRQASC